MALAKVAPRVTAAGFKRTKIIATIGPATNSYAAILDLIKAGASGFRQNFSYGTYEEREQQIKWVRQAALETGKPVALIQDLQGPKIRLGDFEGVVPVQKGQNMRFRYQADYMREGVLPTQCDLSKKVQRGERLYLFDGKVRADITSVKDGIIYTTIYNDGVLIARKGINLPDTDFGGDILTAKDRQDLVFASTHDFDYIAQSYVQTAQDIGRLNKTLQALNCHAKVIAKIETKAAADNLEQIADAADVLMVARGDLAVETSLEDIPLLQRRIINMGLKYHKPTIVASQLLAGMVDNPQVTRAEVSDVTTAVLMGTDALLLTDETAAGKYPIAAVKTLDRLIGNVQSEAIPSWPNPSTKSGNVITPPYAIAGVIIDLAAKLKAAAIVAETKSGATALNIAAHRPQLPIIVGANTRRVAQQLAIVYGTIPGTYKIDPAQSGGWLNQLETSGVIKNGELVVVASGRQPGVVGMTDTIMVRAL